MKNLAQGLGFRTSLVDYSRKYQRPTSFLTPPIFTTDTGYRYFSPVSVFDNMVFGSISIQGQRLPVHFEFKTLISEISTIEGQNSTVEQVLVGLESSPILFDKAQKLYQLATGNTLQMRSSFGDLLHLNSQQPFDSTCISYLAPEYRNSAEYLLTWRDIPGYTQLDYNRDQIRPSLFGFATLGILEGMGYATTRRPGYPEIVVDETFMTDDYDPSTAFSV